MFDSNKDLSEDNAEKGEKDNAGERSSNTNDDSDNDLHVQSLKFSDNDDN